MSTAWDRITLGAIVTLAKHIDIQNPYAVIRVGASGGNLYVADPYDDVDDEDEDYEGDEGLIEAIWEFNESNARIEFSDRADLDTLTHVGRGQRGDKSWNYALFRLLVEKSAIDALSDFDLEDVLDYNSFAEHLATPMRLVWDDSDRRAKITAGMSHRTSDFLVEKIQRDRKTSPLEKLQKERRGWGKDAPLFDRVKAHQDWIWGNQNGRRLDLTGEEFRAGKAHFPSGADLSDAVFQRAELRDAIFQGCTLDRADFQGADLWGATFDGAQVRGADFRGADLSHANFAHAKVVNCDFDGAVMRHIRGLVQKRTRNPEKKIRHRGRR